MKSNKLKESTQMSFKDMLKLVVESGGQQQLDPVDESLFAWAQRVAESKCSNPREREVYAGLVYERMGGVFNMYDVLSESTTSSLPLTENSEVSITFGDIDLGRDRGTVYIEINGKSLLYSFNYEFTGRADDAGFGYEYAGMSGVHDEVEYSGGFETENLKIQETDIEYVAAAAKELNVPAAFARNSAAIEKYVFKAAGGEDNLHNLLNDELVDRYFDDFLKSKYDDF